MSNFNEYIESRGTGRSVLQLLNFKVKTLLNGLSMA